MEFKRRRGSHSAPATDYTEIFSSAVMKNVSRPPKHLVYIICILTAVIALVATAMVIRTVSDKKEYNTYMEIARESFSREDYDSALSNLRKAAGVNKTEECAILMANCYQAQGKPEKALEILRTVNTKDKKIAAKISELENERAALKDAEKVSVAGRLYTQGTTELVLDEMELDDSIFEEVKQLYSLTSLSLEKNKLSDISALSELGGLTKLNLRYNNIRDISAITALTALRTLQLDGNPIADLSPLCSMTSLTSLSIRGIDVDEALIEKLSAALPNCAIHSEVAKEEIQDITFGGVTFKSDVTELSLSGMGIRDISALANCTELTHLDLSGNEISDLSPLMNIPELEWLDVSYNQLSDLRTLMGIESLRFLNAAGNSISGTSPLSMMTGLQELYLDGNQIHDFSGLRKLQNIQKLGLSGTGLQDADLDYLTNLSQLTNLFISDNEMLSGEAIDALQAKLNPCNIEHSELIYTVDFGGHIFKSNDKELNLSGTGIQDFGQIQNMPELERVWLSKNGISNIYILEYTNSRFTIKLLDLSNNDIEDITVLACLQSIEELDLSNNSINSLLPLMRLDTLKRLDLRGNPINEQQLNDLRFALQKCEIISDFE